MNKCDRDRKLKENIQDWKYFRNWMIGISIAAGYTAIAVGTAMFIGPQPDSAELLAALIWPIVLPILLFVTFPWMLLVLFWGGWALIGARYWRLHGIKQNNLLLNSMEESDLLDAQDHCQSYKQMEFTESLSGQEALYQWAKRYDDLNGAPEDLSDC